MCGAQPPSAAEIQGSKGATFGGSNFTDVDSSKLRPEAEDVWTPALSPCPHAGTAVPLQPGMRRLRQDPVSRAHPEKTAHAGRMLQCRGRVRGANGQHSWRRAAHASAD